MTDSRPGQAAHGSKAAVMIEGEVVDGVCFANGLRGLDHRTCARTCFARGEAPMLIAEDGRGFVLIADHGNESLLDRAKDAAGLRVRLSGVERERYGVRALALTSVQELEHAVP